MIEGKFGSEIWSHQDRKNSGVFSPNMPNTNGLDIVNAILTRYSFLFFIILLF